MTARRRSVLLGGAALAVGAGRARAAQAVRIGVLTEMSGTYAEDSGQGSGISDHAYPEAGLP